jgi:hypothetical protein
LQAEQLANLGLGVERVGIRRVARDRFAVPVCQELLWVGVRVRVRVKVEG